MKIYNFEQDKVAHLSAILAAFLLHFVLFIWLTNSSSEASVTSQSISVTMVAPSSQMKSSEIKMLKSQREFIKSKRKDNSQNFVEKFSKEKQEKKKEIVKLDNKHLETQGKVSENAVAENSALVKPVFNASYLENIPPKYPMRAKIAKMQGEVILQVLVSKLGKASSVEIAKSSGYELLDKVAQRSVGKWSFVPAYFGDKVVEATVLVPVEFKLVNL